MSGMTLTINATEPQGGDYDEVLFEFGEIQSITTSYSPSVTQESVVIYGYEGAMCHDKGGVTRSYTVSFARVNPMNIDNQVVNDTRTWSNAKWLNVIQKVLNRWQAKTGGFTLKIKCKSPDQFPTTEENVFISSIYLPKSSNSQVISGSVTFKVGSVKMRDAPPVAEFTITYNPQVDGLSPFYASTTQGAGLPVAFPPREWVESMAQKEKMFTGWASVAGTTEIAYRPQDEIVMDSDKSLFAIWSDFLKPSIYSVAGAFTHIVNEGIHRIKIYCIGGGGAGGNPIIDPQSPKLSDGAGGGASGEMTVHTFLVKPGMTITGTVGRGGYRSDTAGARGENGHETSFTFNNSVYKSKGGSGGDSNMGGTYIGMSGGRGAYHDTLDQFIPAQRGSGGTITSGSMSFSDEFHGLPGSSVLDPAITPTRIMGGGGGGALSFLNVSFPLATSVFALGIGGGNGGGYRDNAIQHGTDGQSGAGGGGGAYYSKKGSEGFTFGGNGGSGLVIVEEFYD